MGPSNGSPVKNFLLQVVTKQKFPRKTASDRRRSYAKHGHSSSNGSAEGSSFSYLNDVDELGYSIRRRALEIKSPWHNTMDWLKKFAK